MTLAEQLIAVALVSLLAAAGLWNGRQTLARQRLEAATVALGLGLERARSAAEREGRPCQLELGPRGWQAPVVGGCVEGAGPLLEGSDGDGLNLSHTLPGALIFTANGLVLGGGTVVLQMNGISLRRCLVVSLPLGITRVGRQEASGCQADEAL
ncbi:MAG: pilus assembly FimT family protein [Synechococcus sp.]